MPYSLVIHQLPQVTSQTHTLYQLMLCNCTVAFRVPRSTRMPTEISLRVRVLADRGLCREPRVFLVLIFSKEGGGVFKVRIRMQV